LKVRSHGGKPFVYSVQAFHHNPCLFILAEA
jgi:hypothetical protein